MGQTEQELTGLTISIVIELQIHNKPNSHNKVPPSQTINRYSLDVILYGLWVIFPAVTQLLIFS